MRFRYLHMIMGLAIGAGAMLTAPLAAEAQEKKVLRAAMHAGLRILDPFIGTTYIVRDHGYMIYDTLFSVDEKLNVKPQMVDSYDVSADQLTYTFKLRDGLKFHDGAPVTTDDVIASLERWSKVDGMGSKLFGFIKELKVVNATTFQMILKEPYGLVLTSLGKPSAIVPFILPKRVAMTPPTEQLTEYVGSGPFRFVTEEYRAGVKAVYEKNLDYKPRSEPADGMSGGKVVKLDRVEWLIIGDAQTTANALVKGEVDMWERPSYDLLPQVKKDKNIVITNRNPLGEGSLMRLNWLQPPLDNVKVRQAILHAIQQEDYLAAQVGDPEYYRLCGSMYGCGTPLESDVGAVQLQKPDVAKAKKMLAESGYKGETITIMQPMDVGIITPLAPVTVQFLRAIGMKVDLQAMDWSTMMLRRANKGPADQGGWHIFHTAQAVPDQMNPVANNYLRGDGAFFGWPSDPEIEKLRDAFSRESDPVKQKELAVAVQKRAYETVPYIPLGLYIQPPAHRKNITGFVIGPATVFWNVEKN